MQIKNSFQVRKEFFCLHELPVGRELRTSYAWIEKLKFFVNCRLCRHYCNISTMQRFALQFTRGFATQFIERSENSRKFYLQFIFSGKNATYIRVFRISNGWSFLGANIYKKSPFYRLPLREQPLKGRQRFPLSCARRRPPFLKYWL